METQPPPTPTQSLTPFWISLSDLARALPGIANRKRKIYWSYFADGPVITYPITTNDQAHLTSALSPPVLGRFCRSRACEFRETHISGNPSPSLPLSPSKPKWKRLKNKRAQKPWTIQRRCDSFSQSSASLSRKFTLDCLEHPGLQRTSVARTPVQKSRSRRL